MTYYVVYFTGGARNLKFLKAVARMRTPSPGGVGSDWARSTVRASDSGEDGLSPSSSGSDRYSTSKSRPTSYSYHYSRKKLNLLQW